PYARVARRRLDLEQALLDFGDFVFKQLANEVGCGPGQNDLLAPGRMIDLEHPGTYAVAHADVFFGDGFGTRQAGLYFARLDDGIALVHALDGAGYDVFAALEEVIEHLLALGIADSLQDGLLGRLGTDATELFGFELLFDVVAHLDSGHDLLGLGQQLLLIGLLQTRVVGHDQPTAIAFVVARRAVDGHTDIGVFLETFFHGRCQCVFKCAENNLAAHVFFTR